MIFSYICMCVRIGAKPWLFFQLNAEFFNNDKWYFSKLDINNLIPLQWQLPQNYLGQYLPQQYPVFVKPEWGQNSKGVIKINTLVELQSIQQSLQNSKTPLIYQVAANKKCEYDIFYIKDTQSEEYLQLSLTQTVNSSGELNPVNHIHNPNTDYQAIKLNQNQKGMLEKHLKQLPNFCIARVGICADTLQDVLIGNFFIIEINLFTPMPLVLLDKTIATQIKKQRALEIMMDLAKVTKKYVSKKRIIFLFFKICVKHYQTSKLN